MEMKCYLLLNASLHYPAMWVRDSYVQQGMLLDANMHWKREN